MMSVDDAITRLIGSLDSMPGHLREDTKAVLGEIARLTADLREARGTGGECPVCGFASNTDRECPNDGATMMVVTWKHRALSAAEKVLALTDALRVAEAARDDYRECYEDAKRLTRKLDVALFGEEGAATQASLCDLIGPAEDLRERMLAAEARQGALVAALLKYGDHSKECNHRWCYCDHPESYHESDGNTGSCKGSFCECHTFNPKPCTCGWDAARTEVTKP